MKCQYLLKYKRYKSWGDRLSQIKYPEDMGGPKSLILSPASLLCCSVVLFLSVQCVQKEFCWATQLGPVCRVKPFNLHNSAWHNEHEWTFKQLPILNFRVFTNNTERKIFNYVVKWLENSHILDILHAATSYSKSIKK